MQFYSPHNLGCRYLLDVGWKGPCNLSVWVNLKFTDSSYEVVIAFAFRLPAGPVSNPICIFSMYIA